MAKVSYRRIGGARRKGRRNSPTLLTLVNPSKKGKKSKKKSTKSTAKSTAKKAVTAVKSVAKKAEAKLQKAAAKVEKAAAKVEKAAKKASKKAAKAPKIPARPVITGSIPPPDFKRHISGPRLASSSKDRIGRERHAPGWEFVGGHTRAGFDVAPYYRYETNAGGNMVRKRKATKSRRRPRLGMLRNRKLPRRGAKGRFVKSGMARNTKRSRKGAAKRRGARKSMKRNKVGTRKARRSLRKNKSLVRRPRKARRSRKLVANRKPRRARRGLKRNKRSIRRRGLKRNRKSYRRNAGIEVLKQAAVGFVSFLGGRFIAGQVSRASFIPESIRPHAAVVGTGLAVGLAYAIGYGKLPAMLKKPLESLQAYKVPMLVGTGIALLDVLFSAYAPASLQAAVALPGGSALSGWGRGSWFSEAMANQRQMLPGQSYTVPGVLSEYVRTPTGMGEYIQTPMGEYIQTDDDGVAMGDLYDLDAGVIDDGLYGDPGDDALDIEVLD